MKFRAKLKKLSGQQEGRQKMCANADRFMDLASERSCCCFIAFIYG